MGEAAIGLVQSTYADFQAGNIAALLNRLTDDVVWTTPYPPEIVPHGGSRKGKAAVVEFFQQLAAGLEITTFDPHEFLASDDRVVAFVKIAGIARETGVSAAVEAVHLFRLRDGKISELREFADALPVVAAYAPQLVHAQS